MKHGVDLDRTLAEYDGFRGPGVIGDPIPLMAARVRAWLKAGDKVDIFTARVHPSHPSEDVAEAERAIRKWFLTYFAEEPNDVTCMKNPKWDDIWDDKTVQVVPNTGLRADGKDDDEERAADSIGSFLAGEG